MERIGKYIYGVIPLKEGPNSQEFFGPYGISSCEEVYPHTKDFGVGVYTISYQDISAVVSDSKIVDYTRLSKDVVARHLIRHQQVLEKVMENFTIIPMRIGTFAYNEGEVRYILSKPYQLIKEIFNRIFDKIEIDIAATWGDFISILKEVGEEEEIKAFKEDLLANSRSVTVEDQMKIGVMVKKALNRKRERYAEEIQKELKNISQDFRMHELMDDKMVANFAFLINKNNHKGFERVIEELNTRFNEKLNFRCVGPLPPYSFFTLEVKKLQYEEMDWARKKLGLNEIATKEEIKRAHQTKALQTHPDRNPDLSGKNEEFDEVTKAYKLLWEYCQQDSCSFSEEEFKKNAILVKMRE